MWMKVVVVVAAAGEKKTEQIARATGRHAQFDCRR
jgi:hypothetical protein